MVEYYLRVEAVNLAHFVYDTDKIQPMRGGSYLLLESVHELAEKQFDGVSLNQIATGASIGMFSFKIDELDLVKATGIAERVADEIRRVLNEKTKRHATFVVDMLRSTGDFCRDNETIIAMNRWRQFQQPTLMLPEKEASDKCAFDGVRPGTMPERDDFISDSVFFRKEEGKRLRSSIYKRILGRELNKEFTYDLDKLSYDSAKRNISGKIALIYLDGNKFTTIRSQRCTTPQRLSEFSKRVQDQNKLFLERLLETADNEKDFKTSSGEIRLEILLWGGDEIEIVVPAWKGWEVLRLFYKCMEKSEFDSFQLTHSGGIVFSNHKAPILQLRNIVRKLAHIAKDSLDGDISGLKHETHDTAHYLVLESFDTVGPDVAGFIERYYVPNIYNNLLLTTDRMEGLKNALFLIKANGFPRNKIFEIIHSICAISDHKKLQKEVRDIYDQAMSEVDMQVAVREAIDKLIGENVYRWFFLADLWDYLEVPND